MPGTVAGILTRLINPPLFPPGTGQARSVGREASPCVQAPKHPRTHPQMRERAHGRYAVSRTRQKTSNSRKHRLRRPQSLGAICPKGRIRAASVFFSFGPCKARFLFFFARKKRKRGVYPPLESRKPFKERRCPHNGGTHPHDEAVSGDQKRQP